MESAQIQDEQTDEHALIKCVQAGAKDEFRDLVINHQHRVYAVIMRQVGEPELAKELTQETFIRAYRHIANFRFESKFSTWLIRIAVNVCSSYFASRRFRQGSCTVSLDSESYALHSGEDSYDFEAIERLRSAVAQLPLKLREVLVLCGFEQQSYEEAAESLQIPIGTVRSRLHKARHELRRLYFQE